jgi:hypothetical protein
MLYLSHNKITSAHIHLLWIFLNSLSDVNKFIQKRNVKPFKRDSKGRYLLPCVDKRDMIFVNNGFVTER